jgi:hypothetical protein
MINAVPADLRERIQQLTLTDVVDLALRNNPATRFSWQQARAAANAQLSAREYFGGSTADFSRINRRRLMHVGRKPIHCRPSFSLNYLLLDFGGRSGSVEGAPETCSPPISLTTRRSECGVGGASRLFHLHGDQRIVAAEKAAVERARRV